MSDYNYEPISDMDLLVRMGQGGSVKINNDKIKLPVTDDFYTNEMTSAQIEKLSDSLKTIASGDGAAYYIEKPYSEHPGYYHDANVFIIKATPIAPGKGDIENQNKGERAFNMNEYDGDTLYFNLGTINDGGQPFELDGKHYDNLKQMMMGEIPLDQIDKGRFGLRFLGVDAPEIPHYILVPSSTASVSINDISKIMNDDNYVYDHSIVRNDSNSKNRKFVKLDKKYYEVVNEDYSDKELISSLEKAALDSSTKISTPANTIGSLEDFIREGSETKESFGSELNMNKIYNSERANRIRSEKFYKIVWSDSSENPEKAAIGLKAKEELTSLLKRAEDILLMVDQNALSTKASSEYKDDFFSDAFNVVMHPIKAIQELWNTFTESEVGFRYNGFNLYGQDAYKRFLGSLYVKVAVEDFGGTMTYWVNAAKYLIEKIGNGYKVLPSYSDSPTIERHNDFAADAFKLWSYDTQRGKIIDSITEISKDDFDDRRAIQKQLVGMDFDSQMKDWTVMIGDCLFVVPPTSIRCVTQTQNERLPLLRSRGSVVKGAPKSERLIELALYFNNEEGINGTEFNTTLPNGKKITYYMNGLRSLISMFKLTPFLPIESEYINKTLDVEAVSLINLQISTMPGYPQCIAAVLVLQEFNYHMYMPELPRPDLTDESAYDINLFSRTINYETMRWYYQRPLLKGNELASLDVSSKEYVDATFGGHTALVPMKFESSNIEFYIPDKEYLEKLLDIKLESMRRPLQTQTPITEEAKDWAKQLSYLFDKVNSLEGADYYKDAIKELQGTKSAPLTSTTKTKLRYGKTSSAISTSPGVGSSGAGKHDNTDKANNRINENTYVHYDLSEKNMVSDQETILSVLDKVYDAIWDHFKGYAEELIMENYNKETNQFEFMIRLGVLSDIIPNIAAKNNLLKVMANELNFKISDFYDEETDRIKLVIKGKSEYIRNDKTYTYTSYLTDNFKIDKNCPGYKFLQKIYYSYGMQKDEDSWATDANEYRKSVTSDEMQEIITERKQAIDLENGNSLKFVKYPIGDMKVTNISAVFGNTMTKMSLKAMDGYAPQYSGGQDTVIEITMQTTDKDGVQMIKHLPKMAAQYMRDFKMILSCWPLRMNSELTKLLGVNEVLIESVDVSTVPGQPGLFNVELRLMSVDRTARNKESLKRLDLNNSGSRSVHTALAYDTKSFFDLKKVVSEAEVYPDLELPTLDELEFNGFKFIRYIRTEGYRKYPDPDFYFVYGHTLGNQVFRDTILHYVNENAPQPEFRISDKYGASIDIRGAVIKNGVSQGYEIIDKNTQAKLIESQKDTIQKAVNNIISKRITADANKSVESLESSDIIQLYSSLDAYQTWDISDTITCMFREKKYEKLLNQEDKIFIDQIKLKSDRIIKIADEILYSPITEVRNETYEKWHTKDFIKSVNDRKDFLDKFKKSIDLLGDKFIGADLEGSDGKFAELMSVFDINTTDYTTAEYYSKYKSDIVKMIRAAADAASGEAEFLDSKDKQDWQVRMFINAGSLMVEKAAHEPVDFYDYDLVPYSKVDVSSGGNVGIKLATSLEEAVEFGKTFGPFQIRLYSKDEIKELENNVAPTTSVNGLLLDPYYRDRQIMFGDDDYEVRNYKRCILMDPYVSMVAFVRNMVYWIKKMVQDGVLLSVYEMVQDESIRLVEEDFAKKSYEDRMHEYYTTGEYAADLESDKQAKLDKENMTKEEKKEYDDIMNQLDADLQKQEEANKAVALDMSNALKAGQVPLSNGKIFASIIMVLTSGSNSIYHLMKERNFDALNQIVRGAQLPTSGGELNVVRKYINALVGREAISSAEKIGASLTTASELVANIINEAVCLVAAEDPRIYLRDSFYDMITTDKRGRMLRAFPTFYMVFIDEGREIGLWKLHDNFYNMSSIAEIQVTKSRKIAADTARIVMTNMFKTYTTDDEDSKEMGLDIETLKNYQYTWKDVFNSIFSPRTYYLKEELARMNQLPIERAQLKPGVRIHLRIGYGADASDIPVVFNGVVAEVGTGDTVEIVCQGDGIELVNPILSTLDAEDVQNQDEFFIGKIFENWFTKGATPRTILGSLLTTNGGWFKKKIHDITNGRFFNQNPYGIVHFGDTMFTEIFQGSECLQNIYEAYQRPSWGNSDIEDYLQPYFNTSDVPKLSAHMFGKSYWDMMHICAGAAPDFIASIAPFGIRSTIFYGSPHFYYAYDYVKEPVSSVDISKLKKELEDLQAQKDAGIKNNSSFVSTATGLEIDKKIKEVKGKIENYSDYTNHDSFIREKRKPFQQYHIYTSYSDIVNNSIKTSSKDVRTCAVGLYQSQGAFGKEKMKRVGPMWVDFDIYPENQKTMTVDTQFLAKGIPVLGDVIPMLTTVMEDARHSNAYEVAWRITANALKDSVKDMYQGELIVMGDPSVKPYDKMWIEDIYENMKGSCEVEAVVHNFSVENGFTTTIYPDCIATIDDRNQQVAHNFMNAVVAKGAALYLGMTTLSLAFTERSRPLLRMATKWIDTGEKKGRQAVNAIRSFLGQEELDANKRLFGLGSAKFNHDLYLEKLTSWRDVIDSIGTNDITSLNELAEYYNKVGKTLDDISPDDLIKALDNALDTGLSNKKSTVINNAVKQITTAQDEFRDAIKSTVILANIADETSEDFLALKQLLLIADKADEFVAAGKGGNELVDAASTFRRFLNAGGKLDDAKSIKGFSSAIKVIASKVDDVDELVKGTKLGTAVVKNLDNIKDAYKAADIVKETIDSSKDVAKAAKIAVSGGRAALASTVVGIILEEVVTTCLVGFAYEWVERWMRNLQVLQIWPLKKDGRVYTAGLEGSRGIVVGSPTENAQGSVEEWLSNVFSWKTGPGSTTKNLMLALFASEDMMDIAQGYKRKVGIPTDEMSVVNMTQLTNNLMQHLASEEMNRQLGGYESMLLINRVKDLSNREEAGNVYNRYTVRDISTLPINNDVKENMIYLGLSTQLLSAKNRKHLKIAHDEVRNNVLRFELEGKTAEVGIIKDKDPNTGKEIADIPFVRPDLNYLICEIYDRLCTRLGYESYVQQQINASHSGIEYKDPVTEHQMIIHSALRAGDSTWHSTGFGCIIEIVNYDLESILKEMQEEQLIDLGGNYFEFVSVNSTSKSKFKIMVHPPIESQPLYSNDINTRIIYPEGLIGQHK